MKTVKRRSQKQEKYVAGVFNAKTVVASGALWGAKGDVRNDKFLIECKTTEKDFYPLTATVWEKIEEEATRDRARIPLMVITVEDKHDLVVFNPKDFDSPFNYLYDNTPNGDSKSFRVNLKCLIEAEKRFEEHVYGKLFMICGKKKNMLFLMRLNEFKEIFKEEL